EIYKYQRVINGNKSIDWNHKSLPAGAKKSRGEKSFAPTALLPLRSLCLPAAPGTGQAGFCGL
ncbi:MAG: hypothetical protein, partial [Olavius algarvensis Gamma 1 endosymbiont]